MSDEADALAEAARNRGLKLVRSRVRTPTKRGFGKLGLASAKGEPVFGIKNGKPTAKPEEVAEYLRGAEVSDWKASLRQVGKASPARAKTAAAPAFRKAEEKSPPDERMRARREKADAAGAHPSPLPPPPPKLEIREAKNRDAASLAELFALLDHRIDEKEVSRNIKALDKAGEPLLVAVRGKEVVGACGIHRTINPHRSRPVGRITILVVAQDNRGQGLGRKLVEEAERRLSKLGCGLIEVTSNDRLREAHAFYRHLGFERTSMRFAKALASG